MEKRLTDMEILLMHQENFIQELHEVVKEQHKMIDALRAEVRQIKEHLQAHDPSVNRLPSEEEPPPHY
jgi:SlyX protein